MNTLIAAILGAAALGLLIVAVRLLKDPLARRDVPKMTPKERAEHLLIVVMLAVPIAGVGLFSMAVILFLVPMFFLGAPTVAIDLAPKFFRVGVVILGIATPMVILVLGMIWFRRVRSRGE